MIKAGTARKLKLLAPVKTRCVSSTSGIPSIVSRAAMQDSDSDHATGTPTTMNSSRLTNNTTGVLMRSPPSVSRRTL